MTRLALSSVIVGVGLAAYVAMPLAVSPESPQAGEAIQIDADDIGGVVTGPTGPEAGVWVIAETTDLPTRYNKTVVTDDQGRYLVPDLPKANYSVWVRGYGLVDSPKVQASPGQRLHLTAVPAPTPQAAAQYFPAGYWYSLMQIPAESEFPGTGPTGNGISPGMATQAHWKRSLSSLGCLSCHQLGNKATREIPAALGAFPTSAAAWGRRVQSGQAGAQMSAQLNAFGRERVLAMFGDWTDRIKAGEVPPTPPRPQGLERNIVITQWDWADPKSYLHDVVSTDRRNPRVNAYGPVYGALELSSDYMPVVDPRTHEATQVPITVRDPNTPAPSPIMLQPSPYWGDEVLWMSQGNAHNPMIDHKGRVWLTSRVRPSQNPAFCYDGSHPSSKVFPLKAAGRHLAMYDPATKALTHIGTCFSTHHLMFAEDANHTLWTSGASALGYLNTKMFEETGDEVKSQGWAPFVLDTNGNGRRDAFVGPNDPLDPAKDQLAGGGSYAVSPMPDGTVWGSMLGFPGRIFRMVPGPDPANTAITEVYEPPFDSPAAPIKGYGPRGMDVDRNGVAWIPLASGHMASFDRRKCKGPMNGPAAAAGQHCPEGWTLYPEPLPQFKGVTASGSVEGSYYTWVDQFDTFGLGPNTPINTGNQSDALLALKDGKWVILRVPYPMGFYTKWMDGRIDDPNGGWKGRGLWATVSSRAPFHMEGGKGTTSKVLKFQLRTNPIAK